jgi:hypothetical protein
MSNYANLIDEMNNDTEDRRARAKVANSLKTSARRDGAARKKSEGKKRVILMLRAAERRHKSRMQDVANTED